MHFSQKGNQKMKQEGNLVMKKIITPFFIIIVCTLACTISYFLGYYHVLHNQYAEPCSDYDNRYHIIIDGNIHEYEYTK
jgi:hypothetical protein